MRLLDLVQAVRTLLRAPGLTLAAVLTLALGIGATATVVSVVDAVLLSPLPYRDPGLYRLMAHLPNPESPSAPPRRVTLGFTAQEADDLRGESPVFAETFLVSGTLLNLTGHENAGRLQGTITAFDTLVALGARPLVGSLSVDASPDLAAPQPVVLSARMWRRYFDADPGVVGRELTLETVLGPRQAQPVYVAAVLPETFAFPNTDTQFWMPPARSATPGGLVFRGQLLARLAPGITPEAAVDAITARVRAIRNHGADVRYELARERDEAVAPVAPAVRALAAAAALVLLIACVNVANLLLARSVERRREMGIRLALGAGRGRLVRQALAEGLVLAAAGGAAGVGLSMAGVGWLRGMAATLGRMDLVGGASLPRLDAVSVDPRVLAFAVAATFATALLVSLGPVMWMWRALPDEVLRRAGASARGGSRGGARLRNALVVVEIALATTLVVGAGLLLGSVGRLARVDRGYAADGVLTFQVSLPVARHPDATMVALAERLTDRLRALPGVRAAGYANQLPLVQLRDTAGGLWHTPDARRAFAPDAADARFVSHDYFAAMGMQITAGRGLGARDGAGQPRVVVVNEALARREFAGRDPVGAQVYMGRDVVPWTIVGVAGDVRQFGLDRPPEPQFFADLRQWRGTGPLFPVGPYYAVRTDGPASALLPAVRALVAELDPEAALFNAAPMADLVTASVSRPRLFAAILTAFGIAGALLAAIGIYGVVAWTVHARTTELGIRMALGASRTAVLGLVLRHGAALAAAGLTLGLGLATAATRVLDSLLFGVTARDAATFSAAAILFALIALAATWLPARRATRVDPAVALRAE